MELKDVPIGDTVAAVMYNGNIRAQGSFMGCRKAQTFFLFSKNQYDFIFREKVYFLPTRLVLVEKAIRHIHVNDIIVVEEFDF